MKLFTHLLCHTGPLTIKTYNVQSIKDEGGDPHKQQTTVLILRTAQVKKILLEHLLLNINQLFLFSLAYTKERLLYSTVKQQESADILDIAELYIKKKKRSIPFYLYFGVSYWETRKAAVANHTNVQDIES